MYFEGLDLAPNTGIGPKDFFEIASTTHNDIIDCA